MSTSSIRLVNILNGWFKQLSEWSFQKRITTAAEDALKLSSYQPELYLLEKQWAEGDFSKLPPIVLLNESSMKGAAGAYSISNNSIYLNIDWLERSSSNQVQTVLTEELGHHLDSLLNSKDTIGDEGELFSTLLHGKHRLNDLERYVFEIENDNGQIILGNRLIDVENAAVLVTTPVKAISPGHTSGEWRNVAAFAALKSDGSVVSWGDSNFGGDSNSVKNQLLNGVSQIFSSNSAFAALKDDGSIITWGSDRGGGNSSKVSEMISSGVQNIFSTNYAFAALKDDGSVVTWGDPNYGGDSSAVKDQLKGGINKIFSNNGAFAALKDNGSVVTWGDPINGGNSLAIANQLSSDIKQIYSNANAFAAINSKGSVLTWGNSLFGGNSSIEAKNLASNVKEIFSSYDAFAALKTDGSVVTWGESTNGGDSSSAASTINSGVKQIFSNYYAFAALKEDSSVVSWGGIWDGGDSSVVASRLSSGVNEIIATGSAFTALKSNGTVAIWGDSRIKERASLLNKLGSNVKKIYSNSLAFAALMNDGSVVTWGDDEYGGNSSSVESQLTANVKQIFSSSGAFAALKNDGTVITWGDQSKGGNSSSVSSQLKSDVVGFADPFADDWLFDSSTMSIALKVSQYQVIEDSNTDIVYTFSRKGATIAPLTVSYSLTGTAINGTDYKGIDSVTSTKSITFPSGSNIATVTVSPVADNDFETDETIILTLLEGTSYSLGTKSPVEVTIINDELPIITLAASHTEVEENNNNAINYLFTRSGPSTRELTVHYTVSGTAELGGDYTGIESSPIKKSITFKANSSTANVAIRPTADTLVESNESIIISIIAGTNYEIGTKSGITVTILEASTNPLLKPPIPSTNSTNSGENSTTTEQKPTGDLKPPIPSTNSTNSGENSTTTEQKPTGETIQINTGNLAPMIDGIDTRNKKIVYFTTTLPTDGSAPVATSSIYDPIKKAGVKFYDLDGDKITETVKLHLKFIDSVYGNKDNTQNGVIVDPSAARAITLLPALSSTGSVLTVADQTDKISQAAINLRTSITSRAKTVNQLGYVAFNQGEASTTITYEILKERAHILLANLESSDVPNLGNMNFVKDISVINGQKLVFFESVDITLEKLMAEATSVAGFGASFRTLSLTGNTTSSSSTNGDNTLKVDLVDSPLAIGDLISAESQESPFFDFTSLSGTSLTGSLTVAREASYNSTIGFYKIENTSGAVRDSLGALIQPDDIVNYKKAALSSNNIVSNFGSLTAANGDNTFTNLATFSDAGLIAPYATVANIGETFFAFGKANSDGLNHFRSLGTNTFGLEDIKGGGDQDYDDLIVSFNFKQTTA